MVQKNMGQMLKQVQQMQKKMEALQAELEEARVEGTAGGGMVKVVANGKRDIVQLKIEKEVIDPDDPEMLEDLILAAINQAVERAGEMQSEKMSGLTGGMSIPGMPF